MTVVTVKLSRNNPVRYIRFVDTVNLSVEKYPSDIVERCVSFVRSIDTHNVQSDYYAQARN